MRDLTINDLQLVNGGATKAEIIGDAAVYGGALGLVGGGVAGAAIGAAFFGPIGAVLLTVPSAMCGFATGVMVLPVLSFPVAAIFGK
ncbi:MAG TPA: hypothetical protein VFP93_00310 [Gammaproteobacteria bacterium]|nr:hypothetical protein [Gammaproteobacteria bacterium]